MSGSSDSYSSASGYSKSSSSPDEVPTPKESEYSWYKKIEKEEKAKAKQGLFKEVEKAGQEIAELIADVMRDGPCDGFIGKAVLREPLAKYESSFQKLAGFKAVGAFAHLHDFLRRNYAELCKVMVDQFSGVEEKDVPALRGFILKLSSSMELLASCYPKIQSQYDETMELIGVIESGGRLHYVGCRRGGVVSFKAQLAVGASNAADAVEFYKIAFAAEEIGRTSNPKRKIGQEIPLLLCADLKLGSSVFSVSGADDDSAIKSGSGCVFCLETEDVEAAISKAVSAGAVAVGEVVEVEGEGGASRSGKVKDPYGFVWVVSSVAKTSDAAQPLTLSFAAFKPRLVVEVSKAAVAVDFYKSAFAAEEMRKIDQELPILLPADLKLGSSVFSVSGDDNDSAVKSGSGCVFCLETEDVDAAIAKAMSVGAVAEGEVVEGEGGTGRSAKVKDPFGFVWVVSSVAKTSDATTVEA